MEKNPDCMNCSDCYSEKQWEETGKYYAGHNPAEVIWPENSFGMEPEGYKDLFLYVSGKRQIIRIAEGSGDNLLQEDMADGYVDYIYYEQYELSGDIPEVDGGMILLKEMIRDKYRCLADCIQDVLDMAYGDCLVDHMIL